MIKTGFRREVAAVGNTPVVLVEQNPYRTALYLPKPSGAQSASFDVTSDQFGTIGQIGIVNLRADVTDGVLLTEKEVGHLIKQRWYIYASVTQDYVFCEVQEV